MFLIVSSLWIKTLDSYVSYMLAMKHMGCVCTDLSYTKGLNGVLKEIKRCSRICEMLQKMCERRIYMIFSREKKTFRTDCHIACF